MPNNTDVFSVSCDDVVNGCLEDNLSLFQSLSWAADNNIGGFTFIDEEDNSHYLSIHELRRRSRQFHGALKNKGVSVGSVVLLQLHDGIEFITAFWGCLAGGYVPAPMSIPESFNADHPSKDKLVQVCASLGEDAIIVCEGANYDFYDTLFLRGELRLPVYSFNAFEMNEEADDWLVNPDDTAMLMFSSGSTGVPKGVMLTHKNLLHNCLQLSGSSVLTLDDRSLTWLPYHHDMGLILFHICHTIVGIAQFKVSPSTFISRASYFMRLLDSNKITITGFPNFAFEHVLKHVKDSDVASLDLSHLRVIYNGAEPIYPELIRHFYQFFSTTGLSTESHFPGFGIAEACVCASSLDQKQVRADVCPSIWANREKLSSGIVEQCTQGDENAIEIASLGIPLAGLEIMISDNQGTSLGEHRVGQVLLRGPNVTQGYYRHEEQAVNDEGWLNTGDLGFMFAGDIYLCGRKKETIIVKGKNLFLQDLESSVIEDMGLCAGEVAICSYPANGRERIVLFIRRYLSLKNNLSPLKRAAERLSLHLGQKLDGVVTLSNLPKTSSGKIRRGELSKRLEAGEFESIMSNVSAELSLIIVRPESDVEIILHRLCCEFLSQDGEKIGVTDSLMHVLGDSLKFVAFCDLLQKSTVLPNASTLSLNLLYQVDNIRTLASVLVQGINRSSLVSKNLSSTKASKGQKDLYFWYHFDELQSRYHESYSCNFSCDLESQRLIKAIKDTINLFSGLRIHFSKDENGLIQHISSPSDVEITLLDSGLDDDAVHQRFVQLSEKPFNLENPPLCRFALQRHNGHSKFLMVFYHGIMDGWGIGYWLKALVDLYENNAVDVPVIEPMDYHDWVESRRGTIDYAQAKSYWSQLLAQPLPSHRLGEVTEDSGVAILEQSLDRDTVSNVMTCAKSLGISPYQLSLMGYLLTLSQLSDTGDVIVGVTVSGRSEFEAQSLVGYFSNMLAIRVDLSRYRTLWDFVTDVCHQCQQVQRWQDFPVSEFVVTESNDGELSSLYNTAFSFMESPQTCFPKVWGFEGLERIKTTAKLDLLVNIETTENGWNVIWEYDKSLFTADYILDFHRLWLNQFKVFSHSPDMMLNQSRLIAADSPKANLRVKRAKPRFNSVMDYFYDAVATHPQREALCDDHVSYTYQELNNKVNQLSALLRDEGIKVGSRVAILLPKSAELCIATLAVVGLGGVYIPLDPEYPQLKIDKLLDITAPDAVLYDKHTASTVESGPWVRLDLDSSSDDQRDVDDLRRKMDRVTTDFAKVKIEPSDPIYIHFTSGSTGEPKGIINAHKSVCILIDSMVSEGLVVDGDRVPQLVSFAFEAFVAELFPTLAVSGTLVSMPLLRELATDELYQRCVDSNISVMTVTPSYAWQLLHCQNALEKQWKPQRLMFGGEALLEEQINHIRKMCPSAELYNLYGPTEATVHATVWKVPSVFSQVLIGHALDNTQVVIVDGRGHLCEDNCAGEILIGGTKLAIGYWQDEEKTQQAFIDMDIGGGKTARYYRTGDIGQFNSPGELRFLGRVDDQVKVAGQRVELGEIEAAILGLDFVEDVAVMLDKEQTGVSRIVAFVVGDESDNIRALLAEKLPSYMLPSCTIYLKSLPKNTNSKLDRKALLHMLNNNKKSIKANTSSSDIKEKLSEIWCSILKIDQVNEKVNFFNQGGDSILALELSAQVVAAGYQLSPKTIYKSALFSEQLGLLEKQQVNTSKPVNKVSLPVTGNVPLTPIQHWFFDLDLSHSEHWLQSAAIRLPTEVNPSHLQQALLHVVNHHDQLRAKFRVSRRGISQAIPEIFSEFDLRHCQDNESITDFSARLVDKISFNHGLFIAGLINDPRGDSQLILVAHHLIVDTVSWRIICSDVESAYKAIADDKDISLIGKSDSYQHYSNMLMRGVETDGWEDKAKSFWQNNLAQSFDIPVDVVPAQLSDYSQFTHRVCQEDSAVLTGEIGDLGDAGPQHCVLAAVLEAISHVSGMSDFTVDLESHGRQQFSDDIDLTRTVGWCTSLYPCNIQVADNQRSLETLVEVWNKSQDVHGKWADFGMLRYLLDLDDAEYKLGFMNYNYLGKLAFDGVGDWQQCASPIEHFSADDSAPYLVIVQAWQDDEGLVIEVALHPELDKLWSGQQLNDHIEQSIARLATASTQQFLPMQFSSMSLSVDEAAELKGNIQDVYPMTPMQEAMFFHCEQQPEVALYHEQTVYRYVNHIDPEPLSKAIGIVIDRHQALRTNYQILARRLPVQVVLNAITHDMNEHTLEANTSDQKSAAIKGLLKSLRTDHGFNLSDGVLIRFDLISFKGSSDSYLIFSFHHIVLDGWSQANLIAELFQVYQDIIAQGDSYQVASPLLGSMKEHVQHLALVRSDVEAGEFWAKHMRYSPQNSLPIDLANKEDTITEGATFSQMLELDTVRQLEKLASDQGVTVNALCLAGWMLFLHTLTGDDDVVTGMVTSGRFPEVPDSMKMLGCFLNTLPIRLSFDESLVTFSKAAVTTHQFLNDSREFDCYPLKDIVNRVQQDDPSRTTRELFQQLYAFENYPTDSADEQGLELVDGYDMTNYDLTAVLVKRGQELRVMFEYNQNTFSSETMQRWLEQFCHMLSVLADRPQEQLCDIDLRPPEQRVLFDEYNDTTNKDYDLDVCMHELLSRQTLRTPDGVAVISEERSVSYLELDQASDQLAHQLRASGVKENDLVAVLMPRTADAIVSFYAVLKVGATFVPIDPNYPWDRIAGIFDDAGIHFAISCKAAFDGQPMFEKSTATLTWFSMDSSNDKANIVGVEQWSKCAKQALKTDVSARDLAYIIFTSGSTGKPKGVAITHRNAVNTIYAINEMFAVGISDKVFGFSSFCFDLAIYDIFGTHACGASMILANEKHLGDGDVLYQWATDQQATIWNSVPTGISQMLLAVNLRQEAPVNHTLRQVMMSGEFIPLDLPGRILEVYPAAKLTSLGGATEGSIWSIHHHIEEVKPHWSSIPYGRPLANQGYLVLTEGGIPCLVDQVGMLYITGEGVAAGYYKDKQRTEAAFVTDPMDPNSAEIVYCTGDIGRLKSDGYIEILGRKDSQVKVQGYRIELGEVESKLGGYSDIDEVAVIVVKEEQHSRMVAFYTTNSPSLQAEDLTSYLATKLPDYMIPSLFQQVEIMPVNTSGKIDRKALSPLLNVQSNTDVAGRGPEGELELAVAAAWQEILKVDQIGVDDNFFRLGGDSIMSMQVAAILADSNIKVRPADIVAKPTIRALTSQLELEAVEKTQSENSLTTAIAPIHHWFFDELSLSEAEYWLLSNELSLGASVDETKFNSAMIAVINKYAALRWRWDGEEFHQTDLLTDKDNPVQFVSVDSDAELLDYSTSLRRQIKFSLDSPLYAIAVVAQEGKPLRLIWCIHHLLVDGMSWRTLLQALYRLYENPSQVIADEDTSYAQWSEHMLEQGKNFDPSAISAWRDLSLENEWPKLFDLPNVQEGEANRLSLSLNNTLSEAIINDDTHVKLSTKPQELMLAAVVIALNKLTKKTALVVDMEHHGRDTLDHDVTRTVGWFTSLYPLAINMGDSGSSIDILTLVKDGLRQSTPYSAEYTAWRVQHASQAVKPQVLFNYLGHLDNIKLSQQWSMVSPSADDRDERNLRSHVLDIDVRFVDGALKWSFNGNIPLSEMEHFIQEVEYQCQSLVDDLKALTTLQRTSSDFPSLFAKGGLLKRLQDKNIEDAYPLTAMQKGMYFASKLHYPNPMYHVNALATLKMDLDIALFERALNTLAKECDVLRTIIVEDDNGNPVQLLLREVNYRLSMHQGITPEQAFEDLTESGFDLAKWPNMDMQVIEVDKDTYHFVQFFHHILLDGWSNAALFSRLMSHYKFLATGDQDVLPYVMPFKEFVAHQEKSAANPQSEMFWKDYLHDAQSVQLPLDNEPSKQRNFKTVIHNLLLPKSLSDNLTDKCREWGCTVSDVLLGGLAIMLRELSAMDDFTFGFSTSIRPGELHGIENAIGMFLNTVPLRLTWDKGLSLEEQFHLFRETITKMRQFEDMPLTKIADLTRKQSNLFNGESLRVLYTSETYPGPNIPSSVQGVGSSNWHMTEFDFALVFSGESEQGIQMKFAWADDIITFSKIEDWFSLYCRGLERLIGIEQHSDIPEVRKEGKAEPTFAHYWQQRVEKYGDDLVIDGDEALTTNELNTKAKTLACELTKGRLAEQVVVVDCANSANYATVLIACMVSGIPILPLDPNLSDEEKQSLLTELPENRRYRVTDEWLMSVDASGMEVWPRIAECEDTAYLMPTSGTTGAAKLVSVSQAAVAHFLNWYLVELDLSAGDRVGVCLARNFDASLSEWLPAMCTGATLVTGGDLYQRQHDDFEQWLVNAKVNVLTLPTSYLDHWMAQREGQLSNVALRLLICGGQPLSIDLVRQWQKCSNNIPLINAYGPTETTVAVSCFKVTEPVEQLILRHKLPSDCHYLPIAANSNNALFARGASGSSLNVGISGELHVSNNQIMQGYVNGGELVAYNDADWATGDSCIVTQTGAIVVTGRCGEWIKVGAYRLPIQKLVVSLSQLPDIEQVILQRPSDKVGSFVIYYKDARHRSPSSIRKILPFSLPQGLGLLPLNDLLLDGRGNVLSVNASIIEEHDQSAMSSDHQRNVEEMFTLIGQTFMRDINVEYSFIDNGGDSLMALTLKNQALQKLDVEVDIQQLLQCESLSQWVEGALYPVSDNGSLTAAREIK